MHLNAITSIHSQAIIQGHAAVQSHLSHFHILLGQRQNQIKRYPLPVEIKFIRHHKPHINRHENNQMANRINSQNFTINSTLLNFVM